MRTLWTSAGVVLLLLLCPSGSQATEGPPIAIHLAGEPRGALPGEPYQGELLIEVWGEGMLSQFQMEGAGWSTLDLRAPASAEVSKNPQMRIPFTVIANDPQTPLIFTLDWDGQPIRKSFDLSVATAERALHGAMTADAVGIPSRPPAGWVDPHKSYGTDSFAAPPPEGEALGKDYSITVSGRFGCNRPDNGGGTTFMPADDFLVQIRDAYGIDSTEAETYTDSDGYFSKTFTWTRNRDPDLYVRFIARNSVCETEDPTWGDDHKWRTATWWDYTGTHLDVGTKWPADEFWHGAVQLQTVVTRAMRWADVRGYDCDNVHVEWPDDDTMYTRANRAIHITEGRTWVEGSACHEFGHHFLHEYGDPVPNAYCNDVCDPNPPWDCTHCNWCRESSHTAFNEGFPNYLGWAVPHSFAGDYGLAAQYPKDFEVLETCEEDRLWDEPLVTEGFVAAVLQDIHDWNVDDDLRFPGWRDVLNMGEDEILRVTNLEDPYSVLDFLRRFKAEYPATKNGLWETAMNNGFDLDESPPGVVTDLTCITHDRHEASTVPNAIMLWDRPDDDASGVGGYSIVYSPGAPQMPDDNEELGDEFVSVSPVLTPGTWYFNIRAIDRAGHWSADYLSYGPIVIAEPEPVDLTFMVRHGWDYEVVPSDAASHTSTWAQLSPTLPGNANSTYFSIGGRNDGGRPNLVDFQGEILIDDEGMLETTWGTIPAGTELLAVNEGPIQVDGGRHMLHYRLDSNHAIAEISETNNRWGRQFVWTPFELTPNLKAVHSGAPRWDAGWNDYSGGPLFFNCQGFRFSSTGYWNAMVVGSTWETVDLNLGLHDPSTGSDDGFEGVRALSGRGAQCTSALLVNRNTMGVQDWDVGVRNLWGDDSRTYWVSHVTSDSRSVNTPFTVTMDQYEFLRLDEFWIGSSNLGAITVSVETNPPQARVHVQWRDDEFTYGGLEDPEAETLTGEDGTALLQLDLADGGMHCLTIFRDAKDDYQEVELTVLVQKTPPDLLPFETAAWHSPFTPRPANDGTTTTVPLPDELPGNVLSTYYNIALLNQTAGDAEDLDVNLFLDGVPSVTLTYSNFLGLHSSRYNMPTPQTVRGGRHTLSFWIDADETVEELDDDNNIYGEQYIWTPLELSAGASVRRDMPPTRTGGWDQVRSGEGLWYNCDGLRMLPAPRGQWAGIAVMPGSASDVDVRFHGPSSGAKSGFAANSVFSGWEGSVIDFVLVHWSSPLRIPLDVGVLATQGDQQYFAQYREGRALSTAPGIRGPYSMPRDDLWHLYEMDFAVGAYSIELLSEPLFLDWGISLHPADESVSSRSLVHDDAAAWLRLAGNNEIIQFVISKAGKYGLVVYKVGAKDLTRDGEYRLEIRNLGPTDVPDTPAAPAVTALRKLYPNPFNARLTVAFDLARASQVEISIHNVAGALVRRLVSGALPAGRHEAVWDGRDDAGREVASGGYFARMAGDQKVQVQKAVLVK